MAKNMVTNALGIGAIALSGSIQFAQRLPFVSTQITGILCSRARRRNLSI
jgi:hypothetical protein